MLDAEDARLAVRFYQKEIHNDFASKQEGRPIYQMQDFVRIEVPGDRNTIIDTFVNESHKQRFPMQWHQYLNQKADGSSEIQGTLLKEWSVLTPAIANELKHFKFYTVEQVAAASDEQIRSIGMAGGMSPYALRDKAKAYLANAKDNALAQRMVDELAERDEQLRLMREQMAEMAAKLEAGDKPKRGRPAAADKEE